MPKISDLVKYFTPIQSLLIADPNGGWSPRSSKEAVPWAYASATTITVPSDATLYYSIGDKIRLVQSAAYKYFYIIGVTATLLTVTGGSDYSVANSAITSVEVSRAENPLNFPHWLNWSPTLTGFSANPTNTSYRFKLSNRQCDIAVRQGAAGTSNATTFTITAPITAKTTNNGYWGSNLWGADDNGGAIQNGRAYIVSGTSSIVLETNLSGGAWTAANGKRADFQLSYEI